jgi:hypothetical protein
MNRWSRYVKAAGLVTVGFVLGGTGVAAAATGGSFLLGHANYATSTSGLSNTGTGSGLNVSASHGVPLNLHAPTGKAPLTVNSNKEVSHLNAALLGGKPVTAFVKSSAVAYALYTDPGLDPALTHGFTKITHPLTGVYCLKPVAGINPAKTVAMVTPEFGNSGGGELEAYDYAPGAGNSCPAGDFEVWTQQAGADWNNVAFEIEVF